MQSIEDLEKLTKEELLVRWRKLPGKPPPPARLDRLIRELAYRLQEERHGKLDKNTRVSLARHMAAFEKSLYARKSPAPAKTSVKILLESGSVLTRRWNDRTLTVQVLGAREFLFEGKRFKSLSAIAREVTGQHLSGPLFFGLKEVPRG
jgi:hypothetical protein